VDIPEDIILGALATAINPIMLLAGVVVASFGPRSASPLRIYLCACGALLETSQHVLVHGASPWLLGVAVGGGIGGLIASEIALSVSVPLISSFLGIATRLISWWNGRG